jgi:hypothetical protein
MNCVEEVINIPVLKERFNQAVHKGRLKDILDGIIKQSKVEFNYEGPEDISENLLLSSYFKNC